MDRSPRFGFLRYCWRMCWRTPAVLFQSIARLDKTISILGIAFTGVGVGTWSQYFPWWAPYVAFGALLLYGFVRANYEELEKAVGYFDARNPDPNKTDFEDETVYISELIRVLGENDKSMTLKGLTFNHCVVRGPAILAFKNTDNFSGENIVGKCDWNDSKKERFWKADRDYEKYAGATVLEDCIFRDCRFLQIGLLTVPEKYEEGRRLGVLD